ncbi:MAG: hypothetical protein ACHQ51_00460 [Elusimicrobiota bacterium]
MKTRLLSALLAAAALAASGCAQSFVAAIHSSAEAPPSGRLLPLRVGLLVTDETRNYLFVAKVPFGQWQYPFGRDLPTVAEQTLSGIFEQVTPIETRDYASYDLIVEPRFDPAGTSVDLSISRCRVVVAMTFEASDASGVKWSKLVSGEVETGGGINEMRARHGQAVSKAVLAAALAMRAELGPAASAVPEQRAEPKAAQENWWAKPASTP